MFVLSNILSNQSLASTRMLSKWKVARHGTFFASKHKCKCLIKTFQRSVRQPCPRASSASRYFGTKTGARLSGSQQCRVVIATSKSALERENKEAPKKANMSTHRKNVCHKGQTSQWFLLSYIVQWAEQYGGRYNLVKCGSGTGSTHGKSLGCQRTSVWYFIDLYYVIV